MSSPQEPTPQGWLDPIGPMGPNELSPDPDLTAAQRKFNYLWVRLIIVVVALAILASLLSLPKLWRASPPDFLPVVRISLLDRLQCGSLLREAAKLEAAGRSEEATFTWQQAFASNPCNLEANRGVLRALGRQKYPDARLLGQGFAQSQWLLRLGRTNLADLELVGRFCNLYEIDDLMVELLEPIESRLSAAAVGDLLKAEFRLGRMTQFVSLWNKHPEAAGADPELPLYYVTWQAGWGPVGELSAAMAKFEKAKEQAASQVLANRLQLLLSDSTGDPLSYGKSLKLLADQHADRPQDHVRYWRILIATGKREEAATLARAYSRPPGTAYEARLMFDTLLSLEIKELAAEFLTRQLPNFSFDPELWVRDAELLISLQRWDEIRQLALQLRQARLQGLDLTGYAWFIEGLAAVKSRLPEAGRAAFRRVPGWPVRDALLGYRMARELTELGEPELAKDLLISLEKAAGNTANYWFHLTVAAYEAHEFDTFFHAALRAYELAPENLVNINNYAAALLMERKNPPLAAQLTLRKLAATPGDDGARLNHALALLQNSRADSARTLLSQIDASRLDARLNTILQLARFELHVLEGRTEEALACDRQIESRFLLAPQIAWLEATRTRITPADPKHNQRP